MQYDIESKVLTVTHNELLKISTEYLLKADEHKKANKIMDVMYDCGAADAILNLAQGFIK